MIFWFSGTGNSLWAAQQLARLTADVHTVAMAQSLTSGECRFSLDKGEAVGFVFPTYSWGLPPAVKAFIGQMQLDGYTPRGNHCYAVVTCGDDVGLTASLLHRRLWGAGVRLDAAYSLTMPNNYVCLPGFDTDPSALEAQKLDSAHSRIAAIAQSIGLRKQEVDVTRGSMAWFKSRVISPLFGLALMSPRPFHALPDRCTGCGRCARACPLGNVSMSGGRPQWGRRCTMCLACYHHCPAHAVHYGRATLHKGQYHCPL